MAERDADDQRNLPSQQEIELSFLPEGISANAKVVKHNDLTTARYRLTINAHRLLALYLSHHRQARAEKGSEIAFPLMRLPVAWAAGQFPGLASTKTMYDVIDQALEELFEAKIGVRTAGRREAAEYLNYRWAPTAGRIRGYIYLRLNEDLKPYLSALDRFFTAYEIRYLAELSTHYQYRMYEMFKRDQYLGVSTVMHEREKNAWGIEKKQYQSSAHFRDKVINASVRRINKVTDITATLVKTVKIGRRIIGWTYKIERRRQGTLPLPSTAGPLVERGIALGLTRQEAEKHACELDPKVLTNTLAYIEGRVANGELDNVRAYTRAALAQKWHELPGNEAKMIETQLTETVRSREHELLVESQKKLQSQRDNALHEVRRKQALERLLSLPHQDQVRLRREFADELVRHHNDSVRRGFAEEPEDWQFFQTNNGFLKAVQDNFLFERLSVPEPTPEAVQTHLLQKMVVLPSDGKGGTGPRLRSKLPRLKRLRQQPA